MGDSKVQDNTAPVAKSELSASIQKGCELSGRTRIGAVVIHSLSESNANCSSAPHLQSMSFHVRSNRGRAKWENPLDEPAVEVGKAQE